MSRNSPADDSVVSMACLEVARQLLPRNIPTVEEAALRREDTVDRAQRLRTLLDEWLEKESAEPLD